jgi:mycofactocin precursor
MAPVELLENDANLRVSEVLVDDEDELLIEEISIDGMCGVY